MNDLEARSGQPGLPAAMPGHETRCRGIEIAQQGGGGTVDQEAPDLALIRQVETRAEFRMVESEGLVGIAEEDAADKEFLQAGEFVRGLVIREEPLPEPGARGDCGLRNGECGMYGYLRLRAVLIDAMTMESSSSASFIRSASSPFSMMPASISNSIQ